jgi:hypothetical protein
MPLLPQALKRARTLLSEPPESSRVPPTAPASEARPSPQQWATMLAGARHRRAPHAWPSPEPPAVPPEPIDGTLVRAYVLAEDEPRRILTSPAREVR